MPQAFLDSWHTAAKTSVGLFWTAFWAFGLGYLVSSAIQVFVTRERMRRTMGDSGPRSVLLGSFFGFLSSSCSFAALSTARTLFAKGAGLVPSLAFLLASTNLVVELGIVIAVFLSWQFVVGEYVGGMLLIGLMWVLVRATRPDALIGDARQRARKEQDDAGDGEVPDWRERLRSLDGWRRVSNRYLMEWGMVWKDVTIGFTVAGVIAAFVPRTFFQSLFVGSGEAELGFGHALVQALAGPAAAFFTFIGSMGNIPLAAVLFGNGVSFAGVMAFIFSDLIVFPVLRIQAQYYGWKTALYILAVFLTALVAASLLLHYGFLAAGLLPEPGQAQSVTERDFFGFGATFVLNLLFVGLSAAAIAWKASRSGWSFQPSEDATERTLLVSAVGALVWLVGGLVAPILA